VTGDHFFPFSAGHRTCAARVATGFDQHEATLPRAANEPIATANELEDRVFSQIIGVLSLRGVPAEWLSGMKILGGLHSHGRATTNNFSVTAGLAYRLVLQSVAAEFVKESKKGLHIRSKGPTFPGSQLNRVDRKEARMAKKKKKAAKKGAPVKARTKSETLNAISEATGLTRKEVASVFESMTGLIKKDLSNRGPGVFQIPGLLKVKVVRKPATKARMGINPFTKEEMMFKAKPARKVVKALPLKGLKTLV